MSTVAVTFKTDSDAFRQPSGDLDIAEVERVLQLAVSRVWTIPAGGIINLRDINGNTVGSLAIEEDE